MIVPVAVFRVRPPGSEPAVIDQVYGVTPPFAVSVAEYVVPTVPDNSEVVARVSGAGCTVKVVLPDTEFSAAEILVVPAARAVASPPALIVAVPVAEDVQVTWPVMFWVLPLEYVAGGGELLRRPSLDCRIGGGHRDRCRCWRGP